MCHDNYNFTSICSCKHEITAGFINVVTGVFCIKNSVIFYKTVYFHWFSYFLGICLCILLVLAIVLNKNTV